MNKIKSLYEKLNKEYGPPEGQWKVWCKRPKSLKEKEEVIIGAVLTQRTNWNNVEKCFEKMKKEGIDSLRGLYDLGKKDIKKLFPLIRSSGFYRSKADYLFRVCEFFVKECNGVKKAQGKKIDKIREELLGLKGVGKETADSILLYALEKPIFVIDEYTKRIVRKEGISNNDSYDYLQNLFHKNLFKNWRLYQDFHALIVISGQKK
ncbi:MAG: endonuclease [Candidatus Portnoybacteria bacterium]|nr:endonuclease [Candidatus Portnoybacteria bacterium]